MIDIEYRFIDKSEWVDGAWKDEPDKIQYTDKETGMPCLIVRSSRSGHLCGYVGIGEKHPLYQKDYEQVDDPDVHGGLTYASFCVEDDKEHGVCHIVEPGEEEPLWWFGFDCAHSCDVSGMANPKYFADYQDYRSSYKGFGYVKQQNTRLAVYLKNNEKQPDQVGGEG